MSIYWLNKESRTFLERGYLKKGVTPEKRMRQIAEAAENILKMPGFADKFESYLHKGWYSLSSPVWANFGAGRGLPISCNGSYLPDNTAGISSKISEIAIMTKHGAGTSIFMGDLRERGATIGTGGQSSGPVHFAKWFEVTTDIISQSNVRRGSCAAYLPIEHPDILEFLGIRGDGHPVQTLSFGICIGDKWMKSMIDGDVEKRTIWAKVIETKLKTGYPYLFFTDTVNKTAPKVYKDKKLKIHASNLCTEIMLHSSADESFVCCLSSLNLLHYDDWKDTDAVETLTYFLDAVISEYADKTKDMAHMEAARRFAINQRALGVGVLGWHSYLQSKMIAFESMEAKLLNTQIHKLLRDKSWAASREMAEKYGEPPLLKGYGMRNVTTMAIAPTTSSSFILGQVSPSIEPLESNYFIKDLAKGKFSFRNPHLKTLLASHGRDNDESWDSILVRGGSVQHLDFLSEHEKAVFKTFGEISQKEIIIQAAGRQRFIDQGQSLNLMIPPETSARDFNRLTIFAWEQGLKSLYYTRSANPQQALARNILNCVSCEG